MTLTELQWGSGHVPLLDGMSDYTFHTGLNLCVGRWCVLEKDLASFIVGPGPGSSPLPHPPARVPRPF
jgi:hypothetical protein